MSYAVSSSLQQAIYQLLLSDGPLRDLVGVEIFDAAPPGTVPETYVTLGPEEVSDASDQTGDGAVHEISVSVISSAPGFRLAKDVAGAVSDALHGNSLILARGRLISITFIKAKAARVETGDTRRIDLRFRARVEDN